MAEPSSSSIAMTTTTSSSSPSSSQRGARELQGPRPEPLRVRRDSRKIRKPPVQQVRQPVIIYTVSPRVVHAEPSEFMSVVQRLTGAAAPSSSSTSLLPAPGGDTAAHHQQSSSLPFFPSSSLFPPAPAPQLQFPFQLHHQQAGPAGPRGELTIPLSPAAIHARNATGGLPPLPSILSPVPGSLPAVPPGFFSPPAGGDAGGGINMFGELISPAAFLGATTTTTGASQNFPTVPSPSGAYYWDLFNDHHHHHQSL